MEMWEWRGLWCGVKARKNKGGWGQKEPAEELEVSAGMRGAVCRRHRLPKHPPSPGASRRTGPGTQLPPPARCPGAAAGPSLPPLQPRKSCGSAGAGEPVTSGGTAPGVAHGSRRASPAPPDRRRARRGCPGEPAGGAGSPPGAEEGRVGGRGEKEGGRERKREGEEEKEGRGEEGRAALPAVSPGKPRRAASEGRSCPGSRDAPGRCPPAR